MFVSGRSSRSFLLVVVVALLAAALLSACGGDDDAKRDASDGASRTPPKCGATTAGGLDIVRPCGKATGEISIDGEVTRITRGACANTADSVVLNLGDTIVGASPSVAQLRKHDYIGLLAGKHPAAGRTAAPVSKDGTYTKDVLMSFVIDGRTFTLQTTKLVLTGDRNNGTFSGTSTADEQVTGSFSCGG